MKAEEYLCDSYGHDCQQLKDCAEISFKAGQKEERDSWLLKTDPEKTRDAFTQDIILRVRAQAIKEVVTNVGLYCYIWHDEDDNVHICLDQKAWKSRKKEWGL